MNKRAILGTFLMQVYALLFLVAIFLAFLLLFPLAKGEVSSVGVTQGDLLAEHILADLMQDHVDVGRALTYQEALNDPSTRQVASEKLTEDIQEKIAQLKIAGYRLVVMMTTGDPREDQERVELGSHIGSVDGHMSPLPAESRACWPFLDGERIGYVKVLIGLYDPSMGEFRQGNIRC